MITDKVTNFIVRIKLDPNSLKQMTTNKEHYPFRPGMTTTVNILTQRAENVIGVPITAVTVKENEKDKNKQDEVVFINDKGKAKKAIVKTGIQDNDYIVIKEGLKEGDEIIKAPYRVIAKTLKEGDIIKVVDEEKLNEKKDKK
jgi:HlyD family secretion protein